MCTCGRRLTYDTTFLSHVEAIYEKKSLFARQRLRQVALVK